MSMVLNVENLIKVFTTQSLFGSQPSYTAVNDISFQLQQGEILGILGPNGAGKTTTIQMLLGTLTPTSGKIEYFGQNFAKHRSDVLQHVTHASAYNKLPGFLTVAESLEIYGRLYGLSSQQKKQRLADLLHFFNITHLLNKRCQSLSAGQMTRVMLVKAFLPHPRIVLLDEPTASLDPDIALETRQFILAQQKQFNVSMIITSHNMQEVTEICNRVLVLKNGSIIEEDTPKELAKSVSLTKLILTFGQDLEKIKAFFGENSIAYFINGQQITVDIDEKDVAPILIKIALTGIVYSHVEIIKPDLEDYFLHISKQT